MEAVKGDAEQVKKEKRSMIANYCDQDGMPVIVNAIMNDNLVAVGILLLSGCDPNVKDSLNCSVLEHACMKGNFKVLALLVRLGAEIEQASSSGVKIDERLNAILGDTTFFLPPNKRQEALANKTRPNNNNSEDEDEELYQLGGGGGGRGSRGTTKQQQQPFDNLLGPAHLHDIFSADCGLYSSVGGGGGGGGFFDPDDMAMMMMAPDHGRGRSSRKGHADFMDLEDDLSNGEGDEGERRRPPQLCDEKIPLTGTLEDTQQALQNACSSGDVSGLLSILSIVHVPKWLERLERMPVETIHRLSAPKTENKQGEDDKPAASSKPPTTASSSTTADVREKPPQPPPDPDLKRKASQQLGKAAAPPIKPKLLSRKSSSFAYSDDSDDDEDDSDIESEDDLFVARAAPQRTTVRNTLGSSDLDRMMQEQCDELCVFFESLSTQDAECVLRHFEWDLDLQKIGELMDKGYDENKFREVSGLLQVGKEVPLPSGDEDIMCLICTDEKPPSEFLTLGCHHDPHCKDCWKAFLASHATGNVMECLKMPCIGHNKYSPCGLIVPQEFFLKHAEQETADMYQKLREEEFVMNNKKLVLGYCPGPDCGRVCAADKGLKSQQVIEKCLQVTCQCPMKTFCMGCVKLGNSDYRGGVHEPATCKHMSDWIKKTTEGGRYFTFRVKHCPNDTCRATIVKCGCTGKIICNNMDHCPNQACNHMHCRNCDTHFCWICGNLWSDHNNYYNCNRELSKDLTPVEFFKGCLERHDDHLTNFKLTKERVDMSEKMYDFFRKQAPACVQADIFTDANNEMNRSYAILRCSYVRRHYMDFAHDAERNLYEMQQGMLEKTTNELMGRYEEFKKLYEAESLLEKSEEDLRKEVIALRESSLLLGGFRNNLVESFKASSQAAATSTAGD